MGSFDEHDCYDNAGKVLKSQTGWTKDGSVSNDDSYSFAALPAGEYRDGFFIYEGYSTYFRSSTQSNKNYATTWVCTPTITTCAWATVISTAGFQFVASKTSKPSVAAIKHARIAMTEVQPSALRSSATTSSEASAVQKCLRFSIAEPISEGLRRSPLADPLGLV